nr:hypothetical protein [Bacteroidota bacterium]
MKLELIIQYLPARNEVVHAFSSHEKAIRVFGDLMKYVPLEIGLSKMSEWVRERGFRNSMAFPKIEIMKNLPHSWQ